ncbi:DUF2207 domain-containing protein [Lactobacillus salsicarnum]|uniref:DUF2207 domain-containing protein n=2 Tax=Companilactobacillus mishanensis TaxID=2486008 RepID=A0A5P0ZKT7_9LACO|nr:DUF2207 domain-containing protein [Companilactobacillus mishanensis]
MTIFIMKVVIFFVYLLIPLVYNFIYVIRGEYMNKLKFSLLGILFALIGFMSFTNTIFAKSYDITKYHENVNVSKDGTADVTQRVTYDFDGTFNGVYLKMNTKGINKYSDPTVSVDYGDTQPAEIPRESFHKSYYYDDTFVYTSHKKYKKVTVYYKSTDEKLTFIYKYKIYGFVTNYSDTAQINWKAINTGWGSQLNNVKVTIQLPENNIKKLQAWAHGTSRGHIDVDKENGRITLTADKLPEDEFMETRSVFPLSVTPQNTNIVHKDVLKQVQTDEASMSKRTNFHIILKRIGLGILILISLIVSAISIAFIIPLWKGAIRLKKPTPLVHYFEIPNMNPSTARMLLKQNPKGDNEGLTGDMLMEVANHKLKLEKNKHRKFELIRLEKDCDPFFNYLIDTVGDGERVSFDKIKNANQEHLKSEFHEWQDRTTEAAAPYMDDDNKQLLPLLKKSILTALGVSAAMVIIGTWIIYDSFYITVPIGLITVLFFVIMYIVGNYKFDIYSEAGEQAVNEVHGFKKMLEDINDINIAEVGDLILWEQILPYAAAFGISKKVLKALQVKYGDVVDTLPSIGYYYYGVGSLSGSTNFNISMTSGLSSSSGGSGGFSGGSSGGSGGSSGGAF